MDKVGVEERYALSMKHTDKKRGVKREGHVGQCNNPKLASRRHDETADVLSRLHQGSLAVT